MVTGATGFLGNNIARQLLGDGIEVLVATRASASLKPFNGLNVSIIELDFDDKQAIRESLRGVDTVIHAAAMIWFGFSKLEQTRHANVVITQNIAMACQELGIRLVHVSTVDALPASRDKTPVNEQSEGIPKPPCNYVVTKTEADRLLKEMFADGLDGLIVHPAFMLGPWDWKPSSSRLIIEVERLGRWCVYPSGGINVCDVRDVARGTILAAERGETGKQYILGGTNIHYRELCHRIADLCGVVRPFFRSGPFVMLVGWLVERINGWRNIESIINSGSLSMARMYHFYSSEYAAKEIGYTNRPLDETLKDGISWLRSQGAFKNQVEESAEHGC